MGTDGASFLDLANETGENFKTRVDNSLTEDATDLAERQYLARNFS